MVRIERLSEPAQESCGCSRPGARSTHALLADASGLDAARAARRPARGGRATSSSRTSDGLYRFRHALLREVVHDDLLPGEHAELHLALARALERRAAESGEDAFVTAGIAHHYLLGRRRSARRSWPPCSAADAADRVHAHGEAAALLERALELWDRGAGRRAAGRQRPRGPACAGPRRSARAEGDFMRAETLAERGARAARRRGRAAPGGRPARDPRALALVAQPRQRRRGDDHARAGALAGGRPQPRARPPAGLLREGEDAPGALPGDARAGRPRDRRGRGRHAGRGPARNARGIALAAMGDVEGGAAELRRAVEIARERENIGELDSAYGNLADALHMGGRTREGLAIVEEGQRVISELAQTVEWLNVVMAEFNWALGNWQAGGGRHAGQRAAHGRGPRAVPPAPALRHGARVRRRRTPHATGWSGPRALSPSPPSPSSSASGARSLPSCACAKATSTAPATWWRARSTAIEFCTEDAGRIVRLAAVGVRVEAEAAQRSRDLGEDPSRAVSNGRDDARARARRRGGRAAGGASVARIRRGPHEPRGGPLRPRAVDRRGRGLEPDRAPL